LTSYALHVTLNKYLDSYTTFPNVCEITISMKAQYAEVTALEIIPLPGIVDRRVVPKHNQSLWHYQAVEQGRLRTSEAAAFILLAAAGVTALGACFYYSCAPL